jgi:hypothetical protein
MSPTIMRSGPYRLFFFSNEAGEPAHVHVQRERFLAKFWLDPVSLARSTGFSPRELRRIQTLVTENQPRLLEAWHEFFAD